MAWRRVYGRCDMATLLHNEAIPPESIKSLLAQTSSSINHGLNGSRPVPNFDENGGRATEQFSEESNENQAEIDQDEFFYHPEKKRRLTDDQVEYLEKSFDSETRLEPERKIQLAKELGLQPRQVAVWFQNRRARLRTKQLEKNFETLRSSYINLRNDYDSLLKEKEELTTEVLRLTDKLLCKQSNAQAPLMATSKASTEKQKQSQNSIFEAKKIGNEQSSGLSVYDYNDVEIAAMVESDYSSNAFEADHSDLSHLDEDEEIKCYPYLQGSSFDYEFPGDEEHDLWLWH